MDDVFMRLGGPGRKVRVAALWPGGAAGRVGLRIAAGWAFGGRTAMRAFVGAGYVAGTVTVAGEPASRLVRLYDRASGGLVAEVRSGPEGAYRVDALAADREFLVVAHDDAPVAFNAATADLITPALGAPE